MSNITLDVTNQVATVTLNRPEKHNALTAEMMMDFVAMLKGLEADDEVKVVVVTGAGEKSFCTGADLSGMSENNDASILDYKRHVTKYRDCLLTLKQLTKPTIAAVNGYALAGGLGLAAVCDITFAQENAKFGAPEINVGLWGMMISAPLLETIGRKNTLELFYTGKQIDAQRATEIGLVNAVYNKEAFKGEVQAFANSLTDKNPSAIALGKDAMQHIAGLEFEKALDYLRDQVIILGETKDSKEGMKAFLEKRAPVWSGK